MFCINSVPQHEPTEAEDEVVVAEPDGEVRHAGSGHRHQLVGLGRPQGRTMGDQRRECGHYVATLFASRASIGGVVVSASACQPEGWGFESGPG